MPFHWAIHLWKRLASEHARKTCQQFLKLKVRLRRQEEVATGTGLLDFNISSLFTAELV
jgi:hypothetical protein